MLFPDLCYGTFGEMYHKYTQQRINFRLITRCVISDEEEMILELKKKRQMQVLAYRNTRECCNMFLNKYHAVRL